MQFQKFQAYLGFLSKGPYLPLRRTVPEQKTYLLRIPITDTLVEPDFLRMEIKNVCPASFKYPVINEHKSSRSLQVILNSNLLCRHIPMCSDKLPSGSQGQRTLGT